MVVMSLTAVREVHDLCRCERDGIHMEAVRNRNDSANPTRLDFYGSVGETVIGTSKLAVFTTPAL